jgi:IS4 transposase
VLVGDSAYASYAHLALLFQRNVHGVFRAHQRQLISFRQDRKLVGQLPQGTQAVVAKSRLIRKLGKYDQIVEYTKPKSRPQWMSAQEYAALPEKLIVRELRYATKLKGGRTRAVKPVTTLLDPDKYPAAALAALYGQRWRVETFLSQLKTIMGMDVLRCKTVSGVLKEMTVYALVYNLVRLAMIQAAAEENVSVHSVSFVDALRWLAQACRDSTPLRLNINPRRPNRQEPRVVKRRPKKYKLMNKPRCKLRQLL